MTKPDNREKRTTHDWIAQFLPFGIPQDSKLILLWEVNSEELARYIALGVCTEEQAVLVNWDSRKLVSAKRKHPKATFFAGDFNSAIKQLIADGFKPGAVVYDSEDCIAQIAHNAYVKSFNRMCDLLKLTEEFDCPVITNHVTNWSRWETKGLHPERVAEHRARVFHKHAVKMYNRQTIALKPYTGNKRNYMCIAVHVTK